MSILEKKYYGGCHCKKVQYSFFCPGEVSILVCNCSICCLIDYQHLFIEQAKFHLVNGQKSLNSYQFGTNTAEHLFCRRCGIKSFYRPRSHPDSISINFRCVSVPPKIKQIIDFDGRNHEEAMKNSQHLL